MRIFKIVFFVLQILFKILILVPRTVLAVLFFWFVGSAVLLYVSVDHKKYLNAIFIAVTNPYSCIISWVSFFFTLGPLPWHVTAISSVLSLIMFSVVVCMFGFDETFMETNRGEDDIIKVKDFLFKMICIIVMGKKRGMQIVKETDKHIIKKKDGKLWA